MKTISLWCAIFTMLFATSACSMRGMSPFGVSSHEEHFTDSGTILLSRAMPTVDVATATNFSVGPVLGYVPPSMGFVPADNETWLEVDSSSKSLNVYRGQTVVKQMKAEGKVSLAPGVYALQHKQKRPLWYAPDEYFKRRGLSVPTANDRLRYRRGALGMYVLYPTTSFPIHSGPVWTEDVGGLKVSSTDLASIYYMLPVGASVVVK